MTCIDYSRSLNNSPIFEPELDVLLLEAGELVPVGLRVEVVGVACDERLRGVRVPQEPLLQPRDLRHCGQWTVGLCDIEDDRVQRWAKKGAQI